MFKVLVIEDEEIIRKGLIFSTDFEKFGCVVIGEATNGEEGIQKIRELLPDIIITDINMPLKNGLELLEETMDYNYSAIIISGYSEFEYAKKAMKYGVDEYLLKPIDPEELEEAIKHAILQKEIKNQYQKTLEVADELKNMKMIQKQNVDKDIVVEKMLAYIQKNYSRKIIMHDLSDELNYSEALLNRKFKEFTKYTFNDYLNRYRIQKAIDLMKEGTNYLYDIATLCGFSDYKYFSTVFKKYIDCSPNDFLDQITLK